MSLVQQFFRSPEASLQLRWGAVTDVWSFGATVSFSNNTQFYRWGLKADRCGE